MTWAQDLATHDTVRDSGEGSVMGVRKTHARRATSPGCATQTALSKDLGNTIDVQRLRDDVVRLADDIDLVARAAKIGAHDRAGGPGEIVFIPDEDQTPPCGPTPTTSWVPTSAATVAEVDLSHGVSRPGGLNSARTLRGDRWWLTPLVTFVCFTAWLLYDLVRTATQKNYFVGTATSRPSRRPA